MIIILIDKKIKIVWNNKNKKHYIAKGYVFTNIGDTFQVHPYDLPSRSHANVFVKCDYCGKEFKMTMDNFTRSTKNSVKNACTDCKNLKTQETMLERYGVNCASKVEEFHNKMENTCIKRYGCKNPSQNQEIKEKQEQTMLERYGVKFSMQSKELQQKARNTCFEHYGVENSMQSEFVKNKVIENNIKKYGVPNPSMTPEIIAKAKETCKIRYGGESSQCNKEIRKKSLDTMTLNNSIPSSKPEKEMVGLLQEIYGIENCTPQFVLDRIAFDCLLEINDVKIDVEYDGWYFHKDKQNLDRNRDFYTMRKGYKVLRFLSDEVVPTKEQIVDAVNYLVNNDCHHYMVDLRKHIR